MSEPMFLLIKRGLYWRPNSQGYTAYKSEAGRYTEAEARARARPADSDGVTMISEADAKELSPAYENGAQP